jgi:hypothetical protein
MGILADLISRLGWRTRTALGRAVGLQPAQASQLAAMADATQADEFDCGAVQALIDQYAEAMARGEDAGRWLPKLRQHFELCSECREELEALLRILEAETP